MIQKQNQKPEIKSLLLNLLKSRQSSLSETINNTKIANISRFIPEAIITQYRDRQATALLQAQLEKVQKFMEDSRVQSQVDQDFNNGNYKIFDPSNGDNMCESRSSLLEIMAKKETYQYEELEPEEKLFLTLCHVMRLYKLDQRDIFGLLVYEKPNAGSISYGEKHKMFRLSNQSIMPKKGSPNFSNATDISYTACELMGHAMSCISVEFLKKADEIVNSNALASHMEIYQRTTGKKLLPQQIKVYPSFLTMLNYIKAIEVPLVYRITRLETSISSSGTQFRCQGYALIVRLTEFWSLRYATDEESVGLKDKPIGVFEMFSISTDMTKQNAAGSLKSLSQAESFDEFLCNLRRMDIEQLILQESQDLDNKHSAQNYMCTSGLGGYYASKSGINFERNIAGSILTPCHFYVSTYNAERNSLAQIPMGRSVGRTIEQDQYI